MEFLITRTCTQFFFYNISILVKKHILNFKFQDLKCFQPMDNWDSFLQRCRKKRHKGARRNYPN